MVLIFIASMLIAFVILPYVSSQLHKVMKGIPYYSTMIVICILAGYGLYFMNYSVGLVGLR